MENISILSPLPVEDRLKCISSHPLDLNKLIAECGDEKAGAVVIFSGEVRNHNKGQDVSHLEYEAYEKMADQMIREILNEAIERFSLHKAVCVHRVGRVGITESAVIVVTASSHRKEAYLANELIIDRVKHEAPIWKREYLADGSSSWSRNCGCH